MQTARSPNAGLGDASHTLFPCCAFAQESVTMLFLSCAAALLFLVTMHGNVRRIAPRGPAIGGEVRAFAFGWKSRQPNHEVAACAAQRRRRGRSTETPTDVRPSGKKEAHCPTASRCC